MKINITQIPSEGLLLKEILPADQIESELNEIKFKKPIEVEASVNKGINVITVDTVLKTETESICSRCLSSFTSEIGKKNRFNYEVSQQSVVDITEDIRQELLLAFPIKNLCRPDCKGLCPKCGKNLNLGPCNCKQK